MLGLTPERKEKYKKDKADELKSRMMGTNKKMTLEQKKTNMKKLDKERYEFEIQNKGEYETLMPLPKGSKYKVFEETAKKHALHSGKTNEKVYKDPEMTGRPKINEVPK